MQEQEVHRAVQYVTASTSYGRDAVDLIIRTGLQELTALARGTSRPLDRSALVEYVTTWTVRRTGLAEPMVREVLGCAGRWVEALCVELFPERPDSSGGP